MVVNPQQGLIVAATGRCQKLLERISCIAWLMTEQGEVLLSNQRWDKYIGRTEDNNGLWSFGDLLLAADLDRWEYAWEDAKLSQQPLKIKLQLRGRIGEWEWFQIELEPDRDQFGQTVWIGTAIDCVGDDSTNRQQSEELLRLTFEEIPMGFCHVALDGTWLKVNRKFCEIIGYSQAELATTTFQAITEPADLAQDFALIEQLLSNERNEGTLEKRYIHKQGHHVWVNLTVSLIRATDFDGQNGRPEYFLCAIEDITARKELELLSASQTAELQRLNNSLMLTQQRLSDRNEELNAFGYVVSHDLKAPLRAISNLSEWIEEDLHYRLLEDDKKQFQLLRQRVKRMNALIDGLLHYSRVGRLELAIETVDVAQLLSETIDSLPIPVSFEIKIQSPLPTLVTKRILLSQVLANLVSNAIKHHDSADGRVEITAEDVGDRYRFAIADNGPGIPGAARDRIFEIFQTLKPSNSSVNTGIGLALVKKIVESEGGEIWLDADRLQGACFYFTWLKSVNTGSSAF
jgi:PAS domain S-box-containing protein